MLTLIDSALVLFIGMVILLLWRWGVGYECCGNQLRQFNFVALGLGLILSILAYNSYAFVTVAMSEGGKEAWAAMPIWLSKWMIAAPGIALVTLMMAGWQCCEHMALIYEKHCVTQHDRVVQIILLPAVYTTMAMASLTRMYTYIGTHRHGLAADDAEMQRSLSRSQTCYWVGDLYEAWALFQFGSLTISVIKNETIRRADEATEEADGSAARARLDLIDKIHELGGMGLLSFLLVCCCEAGWALWLLTFDQHLTAKGFDRAMSKFVVAGFIASAVAIYNIFAVESGFHRELQDYRPMLKFITVKILLTFAFMQKGFFGIVTWTTSMMPQDYIDWAKKVPVLGEFYTMSPATFEMFYAVLLISECFVVVCLHYFAWHSSEGWYDKEKDEPKETMRLCGSHA